MEEGSLRGNGGSFFLPTGEKTPAILDTLCMEERRAVWLTPSPYYLYRRTYWPKAFVCRNCRIVMIPYSESDDVKK